MEDCLDLGISNMNFIKIVLDFNIFYYFFKFSGNFLKNAIIQC